MADYSRDDSDNRHKLASLRVEAIKQTITLALASIAIPTALVGIGRLPRPDTAASCVFWALSVSGMLAAIASICCGALFLLSAPNWAKDRTRERLLDITYAATPTLMAAAAALLIVGAFVAFFFGIATH